MECKSYSSDTLWIISPGFRLTMWNVNKRKIEQISVPGRVLD